jgi:lysozyme
MSGLLGCDVAFYEANPNGRIDFIKMKSAGMKFVIIRTGQNLWKDPKFDVNWLDAKNAGIPRGSYFFYDSRVSPESQAKLWKDIVGNDLGEIPLFADYEESYKGNYAGGQNFKIFLEEVKRLIPNKEIIIYTAFWYWKDNVSISLHDYFSQYKLWIANYGVAKPSIPLPFTDWEFWQYSEDGDGSKHGCSGGLDMNYFNGTEEEFNIRFSISKETTPSPTVEDPKGINTHNGVTLHQIERFGTKCFVHMVDPKKARVFVTPRGNFGTVKTVIGKYKAQVGLNGGGWANVQTPSTISNEIWVSDGNYIQLTAKDDRGFINVSKDGVPSIRETDKDISNLWNVWGFDRILLKNGVFNSAISDRTVKDARTGTGITSDGKIILLSCEGNDYFQKGLSFPEMAKVLIEFGAVIGGNCDGGSSSQVINTAISGESLFIGSDGKDANVINHVLIYATPIGDIPDVVVPEIPVGETFMNYKVILGVKARKSPSMYETISKSVATGAEFVSEIKQTLTEKIPLVGGVNYSITWIQMPDGYWIPSEYKGVRYVQEVSIVVPPPVDTIIKRILEIDTATGKIRIDGGAWQ